MFARLITDSFTRRPRRKLLTVAALSLGMAVVTAALSVALDVGDRLAEEFTALGANLVVTPKADSLPLEIDGVDYRPVNSGAYLPESDLPKIKSVFWHNNIMAFAPTLEVSVDAWSPASKNWFSPGFVDKAHLIGTWSEHSIALSDGRSFVTSVEKTNPWWTVEGRWFSETADEAIAGSNLAKKFGVKAGDSLNVGSADKHFWKTLRIVGVLSTGGPEDDAVVAPLTLAQAFTNTPNQYRKLYVLALTKPEDAFARRDPKTMDQKELDRWICTPYISSIAYSIQEVLPGSDVRVIRRVADGEGQILTRVRSLLWLVTIAALLAAALAIGASSAASVIERQAELAIMKALGAGSGTVGFLLAAEQLVLAFIGGALGYGLGYVLARVVGSRIFGVPPLPSFLVFGVVLGLAVLVTLLGSALPLRRATRCEPAPILRGE